MILLLICIWVLTRLRFGDYDEDFFNALRATDSIGVMTRKFYYIGLMLPDFVDTNAQKGIRSLITHLYNDLPRSMDVSKDHVIEKCILGVWIRIPIKVSATIKMDHSSPLLIYDQTVSQVQQLMYFNGEFPNSNLQKVWEMVEWARSEGLSPDKKALIYGAYMHTVHDLYAHMVAQPSLFGYPYATESDSALSKDLLFYPELYYELFTATYIPDWDFVHQLYEEYWWFDAPEFNGFYGYIDPYSFFTRVNMVGIFNKYDWQYFDFSPV